MAAAIFPPMTMNRKWYRSSNHHLLSEARYRNGARAVSSRTRSGRAGSLIGPMPTPNSRQARITPMVAMVTLAMIRTPSMPNRS